MITLKILSAESGSKKGERKTKKDPNYYSAQEQNKWVEMMC